MLKTRNPVLVHHFNIDKVMRGIREEARRKRELNKMNLSKINPVAEARTAADPRAIDETVATAQ
jgi:hypothetical protein